jgi:hypothetical protein
MIELIGIEPVRVRRAVAKGFRDDFARTGIFRQGQAGAGPNFRTEREGTANGLRPKNLKMNGLIGGSTIIPAFTPALPFLPT